MDFRNYSHKKHLVRNHEIVLRHCYEATRAWQRMIGLLGSKHIAPEEGLLLYQCKSIHTFFMSYPIDVCFLKEDSNQGMKVIRTFSNIKPFRMTRLFWHAQHTLETAPGWIKAHNIKSGDRLQLLQEAPKHGKRG